MRDLLFGLEGRIPRKTYWLAFLALLAAFLLLQQLATLVLGRSISPDDPNSLIAWDHPRKWAGLFISSLFLWSTFAINTKRLHDRNKSGWWIGVNYAAVLCAVAAFVFFAAGLDFSATDLANEIAGADRFRLYAFWGAMALSPFVLIYSIYLIVHLWFLKGTEGPNKYGNDPLAEH
ncbi:MAG: DUF805 domain-containing protein [Alphaproteobacteria bacterium]|nr:DUF805 domain-containing protein [Alphaproteobacteria bacterium]